TAYARRLTRRANDMLEHNQGTGGAFGAFEGRVAKRVAIPGSRHRFLIAAEWCRPEAVALSGGRVPLEASGGVRLETIRAIAETGVDFISVGRITQSAPAVDIGFDAVIKGRS